MDAGGLAQMTFNQNNFSPAGLGVPGAGFASRGKGTQLKRLSVASAPKVASISEDHADPVPTPRTSRSHLLAGLRTQPKTPAAPSSAPYNQMQHELPMNAAKRMGQNNGAYDMAPHTAIGSGFPISPNSYIQAGQQMYSLPEVLAPPPMAMDGFEGEQWDPQVAAELMAHNFYLQERQRQLQQQLMTIQMSNMNVGSPRNQQLPMTPQTPSTGASIYQQQLQNGSAPIVTEVPGNPGLFQVYNPLTGQVTYAMDDLQQETQNSPQISNQLVSPPPSGRSGGPRSAYIESPLRQSAHAFSPAARDRSPPKHSPSPPLNIEVTPLPPPSANAFRRGGSHGHKKSNSLSLNQNAEGYSTPDRSGPRSALTPRVGFPQTPMTGTFRPGQNRAGEHPCREPKHPPSMEELRATPSLNFATRQRRTALSSLRKAGIERAVRPGSDVSGSGPGTPASEVDMHFESDNSDAGSHRSGSLSGKPSMGSLRAASIGAIGSERKKFSRQGSQESVSSTGSFSDKGEEKKSFGRKSAAALMAAEMKRAGL